MSHQASRTIETNGVKLNVVVDGDGPLVVLLHGWPQSSYLWRHQIAPLAAAGFQVAAPDQRGFGFSDAPTAVEAYDIKELTRDVAGIADALGHSQFSVVGHDLGALVAWNTALLYPERVSAVAGLAVPYFRWPQGAFTRQENFGDAFWYTVYFQQPGVAEAELERDPRRTLRMTYFASSGDAPPYLFLTPKKAGAAFLDGFVDSETLATGVTADDLEVYTRQYTHSGFRGGLNWYRNLDRNMAITPELDGRPVTQPALFMIGEKDPVLAFAAAAVEGMSQLVPNLEHRAILPGAGHWLPFERPREVNEALLTFLRAHR